MIFRSISAMSPNMATCIFAVMSRLPLRRIPCFTATKLTPLAISSSTAMTIWERERPEQVIAAPLLQGPAGTNLPAHPFVYPEAVCVGMAPDSQLLILHVLSTR